jgi:hypothetical protein
MGSLDADADDVRVTLPPCVSPPASEEHGEVSLP